MVNKAVSNFIKNKHILLITDNNLDRSSWKKVCTEVGASFGKIENTNDFDLALDMISEKNINIIFCSGQVKKGSWLDFFNAYRDKYPNRVNSFFFLFLDSETIEMQAEALEQEVDRLIIKPFNMNNLTKTSP